MSDRNRRGSRRLFGSSWSGRAIAVALLWSAGALAAPPNVDTATPAQKAEAQKEYEAALKSFEAGQYDEAITGFRKSYDVVHSPNSHFMIARSLARQGRNVEAYAELTRVINEARTLGGRYDDTINAAEAKQNDIRPRIALVMVRSKDLPDKTSVDVEGQSRTLSELADPVPALPGKIHVVAKLPDGRTVEQETRIIAGENGIVELAMPATEEGAPPAPVANELAYIEREEAHPRYFLELEGHAMFTVMEPPGPTDQGFGPGVRLSFPILQSGFIAGFNDTLAVSAGVDYAATAEFDHLWIPVVLQWNVWIVPQLSALFEPGIAVMTARGTYVRPAVQLGARIFVIDDELAITVRAGLPTISVGASLFL